MWKGSSNRRRSRRVRWIRTVALYLVILLVAWPCRAMAWSLTGRVGDAADKPVTGGWVDVSFPLQPGQVATSSMIATINPQGTYSLSNLPASVNGCTIRIRGAWCFRDGFYTLNDCPGNLRDAQIDWSLDPDEVPRAVLRRSDGHSESLPINVWAPAPYPVIGRVFCNTYTPNPPYGDTVNFVPVAGVRIRVLDGNDNWRQLTEAISDGKGEYRLSYVQKCPALPRMRSFLDANGTGYQGGEVDVAPSGGWVVFPGSPPTFTSKASPTGPLHGFRARATDRKSGTSAVCDKPPPEGSRGMPPCTCIRADFEH
jgi:hypothetical protein